MEKRIQKSFFMDEKEVSYEEFVLMLMYWDILQSKNLQSNVILCYASLHVYINT